MKRLWGRLGMEIILDDDEYAAVLSEMKIHNRF